MKTFAYIAFVAIILVSAGCIWRFKSASATGETEPNVVKELAGRAATAADLKEFIAPIRDQLSASNRASAHIEFIPLSVDDPLASKLSGSAYWPKDQPTPADIEGNALHFLAQIRLEQLPEKLGFPKTGLLQFFIQSNDFYGANFEGNYSIKALAKPKHFKVVHRPIIAAQYDVLIARGAEMLPHAAAKAYGMTFTHTTETLSLADFRSNKLFDELSYYQALEQFANRHGISEDSLWNFVADSQSGAAHKLETS